MKAYIVFVAVAFLAGCNTLERGEDGAYFGLATISVGNGHCQVLADGKGTPIAIRSRYYAVKAKGCPYNETVDGMMVKIPNDLIVKPTYARIVWDTGATIVYKKTASNWGTKWDQKIK